MDNIKVLLTAILGELITANQLKIHELMNRSETESERKRFAEIQKHEDKLANIVDELAAKLAKEVSKEDG